MSCTQERVFYEPDLPWPSAGGLCAEGLWQESMRLTSSRRQGRGGSSGMGPFSFLFCFLLLFSKLLKFDQVCSRVAGHVTALKIEQTSVLPLRNRGPSSTEGSGRYLAPEMAEWWLAQEDHDPNWLAKGPFSGASRMSSSAWTSLACGQGATSLA